MNIVAKAIGLASLVSIAFAAPQKGDVKFTPSNNKILAVKYTLNEVIDKKFYDFTKKDLSTIGFFLNDPHHNVNNVYEKNFGSTELATLNFSSLYIDKVVRPMFNIDPRIGAFSPVNLHMYRTKAEQNTTVIAHLTPEAILDILQIDDNKIKEEFIKAFTPLDKMIEEKIGGTKSYVELKGYAEDTMMNFEIPFEEPEDIDDFLDEFQEKFETAFQDKGYIIAGYYDAKNSFNGEEDVLEEFVTFWSYDLCHIPFSYEVFDSKKAMPIAGIFAPCSIYIYVKEGENRIVFGMPTLSSWIAALGVTDKDQLKRMNGLDSEITSIMKSLGGIETPNGNPLKR